jgi:hypothetical protein
MRTRLLTIAALRTINRRELVSQFSGLANAYMEKQSHETREELDEWDDGAQDRRAGASPYGVPCLKRASCGRQGLSLSRWPYRMV